MNMQRARETIPKFAFLCDKVADAKKDEEMYRSHVGYVPVSKRPEIDWANMSNQQLVDLIEAAHLELHYREDQKRSEHD